MPSRRQLRLPILMALLAAVGLVQGCSDGGPSHTSGATTPTASVGPLTRLARPMLHARDLPGSHRWHRAGTDTDANTVALCQQLPLSTIGATGVGTARFVGHHGVVREQVARFADAITADRAVHVLTAWHDDCAERVTHRRALDVGDQHTRSVDGTTVHWFVTRWTLASGRRHQQGVAYVVLGPRIALLSCDRSGDVSTLLGGLLGPMARRLGPTDE